MCESVTVCLCVYVSMCGIWECVESCHMSKTHLLPPEGFMYDDPGPVHEVQRSILP